MTAKDADFRAYLDEKFRGIEKLVVAERERAIAVSRGLDRRLVVLEQKKNGNGNGNGTWWKVAIGIGIGVGIALFILFTGHMPHFGTSGFWLSYI